MLSKKKIEKNKNTLLYRYKQQYNGLWNYYMYQVFVHRLGKLTDENKLLKEKIQQLENDIKNKNHLYWNKQTIQKHKYMNLINTKSIPNKNKMVFYEFTEIYEPQLIISIKYNKLKY